jgi:formamidopyrimidine-DNA glycosylase
MQGARFDDVVVRRPDLRTRFPPRFRARLIGQTVRALTRRAKYLLAELSSGETLVMHLGMSGSFRIETAGTPRDRDARDAADAAERDPHDHVVFRMSSGAIVMFNDPRRFGSMGLVRPGQLARHAALGAMGPEPLSAEFDGAALARAVKGKKTPLKVALLDQRVVAGLGNIYASEALHVAGLSPRRRASTIATPSGAPRESAGRLADAIKQVLTEALERLSATDDEAFTERSYGQGRFRVYDREGGPCQRDGCGGVIVRRTQAGRSTFFCPVCQR